MIKNGGISTIGKRARASITNTSDIVLILTKYPSFNSAYFNLNNQNRAIKRLGHNKNTL